MASCVAPARQDLAVAGDGAYELEAAHASLVWRVKHMGLSWYTARFTGIEAALDFDPANPAASRVRAIIDPRSVRAEHPSDEGWDNQLAEQFFRADDFPQIVFTSTGIEQTGEFTGKVTGDLVFLGATRPVTLDVTFNGAVGSSALHGGRGLTGFSARGQLSRSDFGLTRYASMVGDEVEIIIEAEFVAAR
jgi:polyisoprenoid-binding protein YceI